jgi:hypothetical protein
MATVSLHRHTLIAVLAIAALSGCVRVHPHERETLSRRSMVDDRDVGARRFDSHRAGSREGAEGGTGEPGGGCGCN